jgi:type VI secretion system protein ImpG
MTSDFQRLFQEELSALDAFTSERARSDGAVPLGGDDPDVRRIVEAVAFTGARMRAAAAESMRDAVVRMAAGTLDDLFRPMPASMLIKASPTEHLVEPVTLPRGTPFRVETPQGDVSLWTSLAPLSIRPIRVKDARVVFENPPVLRLTLEARAPQPPGASIRLHLRRFGDYRAALALQRALESHVRSLSASADGRPEVQCPRPAFGAPAPAPPEVPDEEPPLLRVRSFFHFPERDLFMDVRLPEELGPYRTLALTFRLDEGWPLEQGLSAESFELFVVPAENLWTDLASPIPVDGTRSHHPVRSPAGTLTGVEAHAVRGVYRARGKELTPMLPRGLADGDDSFEILHGSGGALALAIEAPSAVEEPIIVHVDAQWSQPSLWAAASGMLSIAPQRRRPAGVDFRCLGSIRRPEPSALLEDPARALDVLALRGRASLARRELSCLLELLGASGASPYAGFPRLIEAVRSREIPDPLRRAGGARRVVHVEAREPPRDRAALWVPFQRQVAALLSAWADEPVEVRATLPVAGGPAAAGEPPWLPSPEGRGDGAAPGRALAEAAR